MNEWTKRSIDIANKEKYLDLLYEIYPMAVNLDREPLPPETIEKIKKSLEDKDNKQLVSILLKNKIFPIKDSYVAYLKRDKLALSRNPVIVDRLAQRLYKMGLKKIIKRCSEPKETNRQMGQLFRQWIDKGELGVQVTKKAKDFLEFNGDIILNSGDEENKRFAEKHLGYTHDKGLDFIAKINGGFIISEAKFLTDFGGHQDTQFNDAVSTLTTTLLETGQQVKKIAILDGVLYINCKRKMAKKIRNDFDDSEVVLSALLLKDYLFSLKGADSEN